MQRIRKGQAYSFSGNEHQWTNSFAVEITDANRPSYNDDGSPEDTPIPTVFRKYKTASEVSQVIEREGKTVGEVGCSELLKFKGKFVVLDYEVVWMLSFRKAGAKKAFLRNFGNEELDKIFKA